MRDFLIHDYFGVDMELTWEVVEQHLPAIQEELVRILKELNDEGRK